MVSVDLLLGLQPGEPRPDVILAVVDASNLERHLYLTTQLLELGVPVVVALNMVDVAEAHGLTVDAARLADRLGVPVVPIRANKKVGLDALKAAIVAAAGALPAAGPVFPEAFEHEVGTLVERGTGKGPLPHFLARRMLLDVGGYAEQRAAERYGPEFAGRLGAARERLKAAGCPVPMVEARTRYGWLRERLAGVVEHPAERPVTWTDRIDRVLTHRVWGTLIFLAVMFLVFQTIFTAAKPLMSLIDAGTDGLAAGVRSAAATIGLGPGPFLSLLCDGVIGGVGGVLVFLPQIVILFGFIAVLEDCGYMARAAFLMDRLMSRCGLSGKSFIPLLSSMACAIPGILGARVIENRRDRLATILVAPLMTCSARLPLYVLLLAVFLGDPWWLPGLALFGLYALGLVAAPVVAWALKSTLLRGETPLFVMELPIYKWPSFGVVARRMFDAGLAFVYRAGTLILATSVLVWALLYFPNGSDFEARVREQTEIVESAERDAADAQDDELKRLKTETASEAREKANAVDAEWKGQSFLGRTGKALEPVFRPLGWDWKIGVAALASFPAREVVVSTLSQIYGKGEADADEIRFNSDPAGTDLGKAIREEWAGAEMPGGASARVPRALSLLVFFALCCQCASTLAVIRRETGSWGWAAFTFVYMTALAYVAALAVFQSGWWLAGR
jgi:ferrous iron transport protein B